MFILIALATMTTLGNYPTQARCESAIRHIYEQQIDPYHMIKANILKKVVDTQMQYDAPTKYRCQEI